MAATATLPRSIPAHAYDMAYYARCGLAGGLCCSITHTVLVPLDVVKTRMQTHPAQHPNPSAGFRQIVRAEGARALLLGLTPTAIGYGLQGALKFGLFELFKREGTPYVGEDFVRRFPTLYYLAASGAAEVVGSTALCPWEATRIRMVSNPAFAANTLTGMSKIWAQEGAGGFYRGLAPILLKQLPYTMVQLTVFSHALNAAYSTILPSMAGVTKADLSTSQQLAVSVSCGIVAGVASSLASHPGDTILSRINMAVKQQSATGRADGGAGAPARPSLTAVVRDLGFRRLWLGVGTRCVMTASLSAGMFLIYDSVRVMCGLPCSGGSK